MTERHQNDLAQLGQLLEEALHEMNNPLAGLSMGVQLLDLSMGALQQTLQADPPDRETAQGLVERAQEQLARMTHALELLGQLQSGLHALGQPLKLHLETLPLGTLVQTLLSRFQNQPRFAQMHFQVDVFSETCRVSCDLNRMEQVFFNLLKNALEATEGHGTVWIAPASGKPGQCILEISDSGPGIPSEALIKIFEPFYSTRPVTGTGLGLSLCRRILLEHGGDISVYNKPDRGACFRLVLPAQSESI